MITSTSNFPHVSPFFHKDTNTFTYVVHEGEGGAAAIIDPVLDFDPAAASISTGSIEAIVEYVQRHRLRVEWILETHAHADHLSAAGYLHDMLGAPVAIGRGIVPIQVRFKALFGMGDEFIPDGRQFNRLFDDGDTFRIGQLQALVIATPGHTDDSLAYVIGDAAFVGDTILAPETGTARTDFPGGHAARLYASIQKILMLPGDTRIFLCHDYPTGNQPPTAECTIDAQRRDNVHIKDGIGEAEFVAVRHARDASLAPPRLFLPALQVNIRGGRLPEPDTNGISYFRLPLNQRISGS